MAFSGVHVACLFVGGVRGSGLELAGKIAWSNKTLAANTASAAAPDVSRISGVPSFEVSSATADLFVAVGPNPTDPSAPVVLVRAGTDRNIICDPGDKLAYSLA